MYVSKMDWILGKQFSLFVFSCHFPIFMFKDKILILQEIQEEKSPLTFFHAGKVC